MMASSAGRRIVRSWIALCVGAVVSAAVLISPAPSVAGPCPGAVSCPYLSVQSFGDAPGLLRSPQAVAVDPATGNIFVADSRSYRISKFDPSGNLLGQFGSYGSGGNGLLNGSINGLVVAGGNLYATTYSQIQEFTLAGAFVRQNGSFGQHPDGTTAGEFWGIQGIATDGTTLYIVDSGNNRIQTYDLALTTPRVIVNGSAGGSGLGQLNGPDGVAWSGNGNYLYVADTSNNRVDQFGPVSATSAPPVGSFGSAGNGANGFNYPSGIAADAAGNLFIADSGNIRVSEWSNTGSWTPTRTWGAYGVANGRFTYPTAAATDAAGNVYVAEGQNPNRVQKFDGTGTFLAKFGGNGDAPGRFDWPSGVAVAPNGVFYEADYSNSIVQRLSPSGVPVGGPLTGPVLQSAFNFGTPTGLATDGAGNLSVTDSYNFRIDRFDSSGTFLNEFGGPAGNGNGQLQRPRAIAVDALGNTYVADSGNNRIEVFDASGNFVRKWGQLGSGSGAAGDLNAPSGVALDGLGNVFVADGYSRVDEFTTTGTFERMWGWGVQDGTSNMLQVCSSGCVRGRAGPGPGALAQPIGIAIAGGNVWVLDLANAYVQGFTPTGSYVGSFGNQGTAPGQFGNPQALASDTAGNLYVADSGLNTIQKFIFTLPAPPKPPTPAPAPPAPPAPTPAHGLLAKLAALRVKSLMSGGLFVPCKSDQPATCYVTLVLGAHEAKALGFASSAKKRAKKYKAVVIGSGSSLLAAPGTANVHVKLTGAGKRALRRLRARTLKLALAGKLTNAAGQVTPLTGSVTVTRR